MVAGRWTSRRGKPVKRGILIVRNRLEKICKILGL